MIPAKKLSNDENLEVNVVISRKNKDSDFPKLLISYLKTLNATYGAKVRGSVFKMKFRFFLENLNLLRPLQDLPSF